MNVVLIGYRGTGKTSVARRLGKLLKMPMVDADEELQSRAGRTIREIFSSEGEGAFRDLETEVVADLLKEQDRVVALGGGAVLREANRQAIRASQNRVFWLQAGAETIHRRLHRDRKSPAQRPNLTTAGGLAEIVELLSLREPLYRECAEFVVDTEGKSTNSVAAEIVSLLNRSAPP